MKVTISRRVSVGGERAYTLIEVIVSAAVLALMVVFFFASLTGGFAIANTFRQELRATQILTQKAEFVRLCTWSQVQSLPSTFQDYYYSFGATNSSSTTATYYGTISVGTATNIPITSSYRDKVRLVTIGLTWTNNFGSQQVPHYRQVQTLVAYYGLVNYLYGPNFTQQ